MQCHPPRTPIRHWFLIVGMSMVFPGALILVGLVIVSDLMTDYQTPALLKGIFAIVSAVLGVGLMLAFLRWEQDRWYWVLDEEKLIGGRKKDKVFPLSSVIRVVPGLPDKTNPLIAVNKYVNPEIWTNFMSERKRALLLKFVDGSFMPFHVHRCVNGTPFMTALVKRLADCFDSDYEYTRREVKALRSADWNRVVKRKIT